MRSTPATHVAASAAYLVMAVVMGGLVLTQASVLAEADGAASQAKSPHPAPAERSSKHRAAVSGAPLKSKLLQGTSVAAPGGPPSPPCGGATVGCLAEVPVDRTEVSRFLDAGGRHPETRPAAGSRPSGDDRLSAGSSQTVTPTPIDGGTDAPADRPAGTTATARSADPTGPTAPNSTPSPSPSATPALTSPADPVSPDPLAPSSPEGVITPGSINLLPDGDHTESESTAAPTPTDP